jgi:hypothetical protein
VEAEPFTDEDIEILRQASPRIDNYEWLMRSIATIDALTTRLRAAEEVCKADRLAYKLAREIDDEESSEVLEAQHQAYLAWKRWDALAALDTLEET